MKYNKGFTAVTTLLIILGLTIFGGIYYKNKNNHKIGSIKNTPSVITEDTTQNNNPTTVTDNSTATANNSVGNGTTQSNELPYFGFNAKGLSNIDEQITYTDSYLSKIPDETRKELAIRVTGGTTSQTTDGNDWTDKSINQWTSLQKKYHVRFIYVVNGNDSAENQAKLINRWLGAGAKFDFIEMMNEYYLPKFALGNTSFDEVTKKVTPESYAEEILPNYWNQLDQFNLPYYIIFAPSKSSNDASQSRLDSWNDTMINDVIKKYPNRNLNAVIHLYDTGENLASFDYSQIDRLRKELPSNRHIAITEAGIINPSLNESQVGELAVDHYKNIIGHLKPGDYLLDQVLYNPSKNNNTSNLNPASNGVTAKGNLILDFINNQYK